MLAAYAVMVAVTIDEVGEVLKSLAGAELAEYREIASKYDFVADPPRSVCNPPLANGVISLGVGRCTLNWALSAIRDRRDLMLELTEHIEPPNQLNQPYLVTFKGPNIPDALRCQPIYCAPQQGAFDRAPFVEIVLAAWLQLQRQLFDVRHPSCRQNLNVAPTQLLSNSPNMGSRIPESRSALILFDLFKHIEIWATPQGKGLYNRHVYDTWSEVTAMLTSEPGTFAIVKAADGNSTGRPAEPHGTFLDNGRSKWFFRIGSPSTFNIDFARDGLKQIDPTTSKPFRQTRRPVRHTWQALQRLQRPGIRLEQRRRRGRS